MSNFHKNPESQSMPVTNEVIARLEKWVREWVLRGMVLGLSAGVALGIGGASEVKADNTVKHFSERPASVEFQQLKPVMPPENPATDNIYTANGDVNVRAEALVQSNKVGAMRGGEQALLASAETQTVGGILWAEILMNDGSHAFVAINVGAEVLGWIDVRDPNNFPVDQEPGITGAPPVTPGVETESTAVSPVVTNIRELDPTLVPSPTENAEAYRAFAVATVTAQAEKIGYKGVNFTMIGNADGNAVLYFDNGSSYTLYNYDAELNQSYCATTAIAYLLTANGVSDADSVARTLFENYGFTSSKTVRNAALEQQAKGENTPFYFDGINVPFDLEVINNDAESLKAFLGTMQAGDSVALAFREDADEAVGHWVFIEKLDDSGDDDDDDESFVVIQSAPNGGGPRNSGVVRGGTTLVLGNLEETAQGLTQQGLNYSSRQFIAVEYGGPVNNPTVSNPSDNDL